MAIAKTRLGLRKPKSSYKDKPRKDLAAIVAKAVKKGVRKELSNIESRKRDSDSDSRY